MTLKKIKLLIFGADNLGEIGGVPLSYQWLLEYLADKQFEVRLLSHTTTKSREEFFYPLPDYVEYDTFSLEDSISSRKHITQLAMEYHPHVVLVVNSSWRASLIVHALKDTPYPVILSERGSATYCLSYIWQSLRQREVAHFCADFSHMLMPSYKKALPKWMNHRLQIIPSATQPSEHIATPDKSDDDGFFYLIYVGRATFEKNLITLIHAFEQIHLSFPQWKLQILGDIEAVNSPQTYKEIYQAITDYGITEKVLLRGSIALDKVYEYYKKSHLFILPSLFEGCPIALREAMSCGLPVIGFEDCSGTNEIIHHNRNGLLASAIDKPLSLAQSMSSLMGSANMRAQFGKQGREDIKLFNPLKIHQQWEALLRKAATYYNKKRALRVKRALYSPIKYLKYTRLSRQIDLLPQIQVIRSYHYSSWDKKMILGKLLREYAIIHGSVLFEATFYEKQILDIKLSGMDPLLHYLQFGWKKGYLPSQEFDTHYYFNTYMKGDLTICPLRHYYHIGRRKNYLPNAQPSQKLLKTLAKEFALDQEVFGPTAYPPPNFNNRMILTGDHLTWIRYAALVSPKRSKNHHERTNRV